MSALRPVVVKLGGSLAESGKVAGAMQCLATHAGTVIAIPGGGEFADAVRVAQSRRGFSEAAAHHLALLAMRMNGIALADRAGSPWCVAGSVRQALEAVQAGRVPLCVPVEEVLASPELPASWDVTSDSIAAWVAVRIEARALLLLKSCPIEDDVMADAAGLARLGVADKAFPCIIRPFAGPWCAVSTEHGPGRLAEVLVAMRPAS